MADGDPISHTPSRGAGRTNPGSVRIARHLIITLYEEKAMNVSKRSPILWLVLANAIALAVLVLTPPVASAGGINDYCDETEVAGCGCLDATVWYPGGCYDHAGPGFSCVDDCD